MISGIETSDISIELIAVNQQLKAFYKGNMINFFELPEDIMGKLIDLMISDKDAMKILNKTKNDTYDMLKQYCWCNFGGINHEADIIGNHFEPEYWDCGKRGSCQFEGKICKQKLLGKRELEFARLLATGLLDKEIANIMNITYSTACDYRIRIQQKTGTSNKVELVAKLFHENLIN